MEKSRIIIIKKEEMIFFATSGKNFFTSSNLEASLARAWPTIKD